MFDISKLPIVVATSRYQAENLAAIADSINFYIPVGTPSQSALYAPALRKSISCMLERLLNRSKGTSTFVGIPSDEFALTMNCIHSMCVGVGSRTRQQLNVLTRLNLFQETVISIRGKLTFTTASGLGKPVFSNARTLTPSPDFIAFARRHGAYAKDSGTQASVKAAETFGDNMFDVSKLPIHICVGNRVFEPAKTDHINIYVPSARGQVGIPVLRESVRAGFLKSLSNKLGAEQSPGPFNGLVRVSLPEAQDVFDEVPRNFGVDLHEYGYNILTSNCSVAGGLKFSHKILFTDENGLSIEVFDDEGKASLSFFKFALRHGALPVLDTSDTSDASKEHESPALKPMPFEQAIQLVLDKHRTEHVSPLNTDDRSLDMLLRTAEEDADLMRSVQFLMAIYRYPEVCYADFPKYPGLSAVHAFREGMSGNRKLLAKSYAYEQLEDTVAELSRAFSSDGKVDAQAIAGILGEAVATVLVRLAGKKVQEC